MIARRKIKGLWATLFLGLTCLSSPAVLAQNTTNTTKELDFSKAPKTDPDKKADVLTPKTDNTSKDLKANPFVLPKDVGVKPEPKANTQHGMKISDKDKAGYSAVTKCVLAERGKRDWRGQSELKFTNVCNKPVQIAARICVNGKSDQIETFTLKDKGGLFSKYDSHSKKVSHGKSDVMKFRYGFCSGATCTPSIPTNCGGD